QHFQRKTRICASMKSLQAHFLQLAVDRLNPRAISANKSSIVNGIAGHIPTLFGNEPHAPMDVAQLLVQVTDVALVPDNRTAFRQWVDHVLNQGQLVPFGRQQLKRHRDTRRITQQMQLPAEVELTFTRTIAPVLVALDFATAFGSNALAYR